MDPLWQPMKFNFMRSGPLLLRSILPLKPRFMDVLREDIIYSSTPLPLPVKRMPSFGAMSSSF